MKQYINRTISLVDKVYLTVPFPLMSVKIKKTKHPTAGGLSSYSGGWGGKRL